MKNTDRVPNTFAVIPPVDTRTGKVGIISHEAVLIEIDWENGSMAPIMQGPVQEIYEEAKGRAHLQSAEHQRDVRSEMAIEFITDVLGYPSQADAPDAKGEPISEHLQWNIVTAMERSPEFQSFLENVLDNRH